MSKYVLIYVSEEDSPGAIPIPKNISVENLEAIVYRSIRTLNNMATDKMIESVIHLYNDYAKRCNWVPCVAVSPVTRSRLIEHIKDYPVTDNWEIIFSGMSLAPISNPKRVRRPTLDLLVTGSRVHEMFNWGSREIPDHDMTPLRLVEIYNEYAVKYKWQKIVKTGDNLKRRITKAIKELSEQDQWHTVMRGLLADDFFSGRKNNYKTSIDTLLFKSRYMTFYNAGLETNKVETVDDIITGFQEMLKAMP